MKLYNKFLESFSMDGLINNVESNKIYPSHSPTCGSQAKKNQFPFLLFIQANSAPPNLEIKNYGKCKIFDDFKNSGFSGLLNNKLNSVYDYGILKFIKFPVFDIV